MFGIDPAIIAIIALAGASAAGVAYAFLAPNMEQEKTAGRRFETAAQSEADRLTFKAGKDRIAEVAKRKRSVQDTLKELDAKQQLREGRTTRPPMSILLKQAGLKTSTQQFFIVSAIVGLIAAAIAFLLQAPIYVVLAMPIVAGLGLPRWVIGFLRKRRVNKFLEEFPNALDIIVRAVKSGLPLNDGIRLIANEAREPVRTEFRRIVESQQIGLSIPEATGRMTETMPTPEASFFAIVIQIQSQAGGNLAEALGNLSRVLRDRKKMKAKIKALSMEAKASAAVIACLPFAVAFLVYLSSPSYIMPLFTTSAGHLTMGVGFCFMAVGIFVMRQMMNFEV